jgi:CheY-like chemotaxis protein
MPGGGLLTLRTSNVDTTATPLACPDADLPPGRYVRLTVSDTGHGMPPDVAQRAFDPFFTTKPPGEGTGLGLATVYGIVTRAGGDVRLRSTAGQGTVFDIFIPPAESSISGAPRRAALDADALGGTETVLVVDDEPGICDISHRILTSAGYQVSAHTAGQAAIDALAGGEQQVDLLLTDVVMPRMSGRELASRIRSLQPDIQVLYMSGYADALLDAQGAPEPGITVLSKPFSAPALLRAVRAVLDPAPTR